MCGMCVCVSVCTCMCRYACVGVHARKCDSVICLARVCVCVCVCVCCLSSVTYTEFKGNYVEGLPLNNSY